MRSAWLLALLLAACSSAEPISKPGIADTWGTSQHFVFDEGDELIENYLVLGSDNTERRYFRVKETSGIGLTNLSSTTCARGSYTIDAGVLVSDLVVKESSTFTDAQQAPSSRPSHETANAALVGPQLRVERIDIGNVAAPVIIYDRMTLPDDIDATCPP